MNYHIITLGCPKNSVDSEGMGGILSAQGHTEVSTANDADVVIVNTCSFIAAARDETVQVLAEMGRAKPHGQTLIAAGCMAESHGEIVSAVAGVDAILGTREWMRIGEVVRASGWGLGAREARKAPSAKSFDIIPLSVATSAIPMTTSAAVGSLSAASTVEGVVSQPLAPSPQSLDLAVPGDYADWRTAPIRRRMPVALRPI